MSRDPLAFKAAIDRHLAAIEALAGQPYDAAWPVGVDPRHSIRGTDFVLAALQAVGGFYEADDAHEASAEAGDELESERWGVVNALDARWGAHATVSMEEYADLYDEGSPLPAFFTELCELDYYGDLQTWDAGGRRVAVSVGHADKEEPVVLFAGVLDIPDP